MKLKVMSKKIEIEIPEGKVAEWKEVNGVMTLVLVDEADNRPVTERIKTVEDAVEATGMKLPFDDNQLSYLPKDIVAYMKLRIIAAALNGLTEDTIDEFPKFTDDEYRYYPWFYLKMDEENKKTLWRFGGHTYNASNCVLASESPNDYWSGSISHFSSRLAVKSEELAKYFGQQFIDIWSDYVALQRKEE